MHQAMLQKRLEQLRAKQREEALKEIEEMQATFKHQPPSLPERAQETEPTLPEPLEVSDDATTQEETQPAEIEEADLYMSEMDPEPLPKIPRDNRELEVVNPREEARKLVCRRSTFIFFPA